MTTSPNSVSRDSFAGATLDDRYRLDGLIGRGGMASVYRGVDLALGRPVAVKVFAEAAEGIDDAERRRSETALLASLSHRALVRLYDASRDPATDREFLVMELVEGRDLRETLRLGALGPADAADMLADVAEALHVIHERGIVHRDVKPANVLLEPAHLPSRTWNAKLADFGIARLIDDARITRAGLLVGTPGYLSPEQVTGRPPTPAADVYALGLLVLESRTGETPFPGPAAEAASARLVRDPDIPESLGTDWVALLRAMTAREAADRPSALDVAVAAGQLDRGTDGARPATAPTIAIADVAAAPTMAVDGHAASVAPATADGAAPEAAAPVETAATRVLPAPDRSFFAAPVAASQQPEGRARARERERSADGERRWVRPTIAIALLVTIGVVVFTLLQSALSTPATNTTPEPLPSVPGDLGVHLEQLDEAVSGG
ncbi:serine/threonine protein kinase [Agromyces ramosus]|uniref:non-specific serine/threonine protein kinase n=1 Tax=Agromyces ramosus TaxID=33879 RepID=A0A4Q7MDP7_9MICO|nr:serine/threonine-protein kinase [Agromyces ramosus]RZS64852.1 serine/threonine protein kinase [Agromyces ramosus]